MDILVNWLKALHDADEIIEIRSIDPKPVISGFVLTARIFRRNWHAMRDALSIRR